MDEPPLWVTRQDGQNFNHEKHETHKKKTAHLKFTLFPSPVAKAMGDRSVFSLQPSV